MTEPRPSHECQKMKANPPTKWGESISFIEFMEPFWGGAIGWVARNEDYATFINYCPFCGQRLLPPSGEEG